MDQQTNLILLKGVDQTRKITDCRRDPETGKYQVRFGGERVYRYGPEAVEWLTEAKSLDPCLYRVEKDGKILERIQSIREFSGSDVYWYVEFSGGKSFTARKGDLKIQVSCFAGEQARDRFSYLRNLAQLSELRDENGASFLGKSYDRLKFVSRESALAVYLCPEENPVRRREPGFLIFPFGGNTSQLRAVREAFSSGLSVIQGPPGTGKTQTILNILANLLIREETALVVSNNNSATENVLEKLAKPENGLDFLVASLGKAENKQQFLDSQTGNYPDLSAWEQTPARMRELEKMIGAEVRELEELFKAREKLAEIRQEMDALRLEARHFGAYRAEHPGNQPARGPRKGIRSETVLELMRQCSYWAERRETLPAWVRIRISLLEGAFEWRLCRNMTDTISGLQGLFYTLRWAELRDEALRLEKILEENHADRKLLALTQWSGEYLRGRLFGRFGGKKKRKKFAEEDLWMHPDTIVQEYPIILSTTFSSVSSLKNVTYDCIVMDEASQVDIATGALAMSCGRSAVVVGDLRQLPNVVSRELKQKTDALFRTFRLPEGYAFADNSFLRSVCRVVPNVPQTLLREHYRCHPKIIEFCNRQFYHGALTVMTRDQGEPDPLRVVRTNQGNHRRGHVNQRQIDVTLQEVLPGLSDVASGEIGIIAPYRDQANAIRAALPDPAVEADTVHKFQGREKDAIVLMTVDDLVTEFSDNPYLLNVAVSRAKKRLCLVTSGNEQPEDSNLQSLISYIRYQNFQVVDSKVYSVFDLLYQQYTAQYMEFLAKHRHVSEFASENLLYAHLETLLEEMPDAALRISCHHPLGQLLRDTELLTEEEKRYAFHPGTHVDFLVYHAVSMLPVLAIEVDGVHYHRAGTRQAQHDSMKNEILRKYRIPLLRLSTNGSGETEQIRRALECTGGIRRNC